VPPLYLPRVQAGQVVPVFVAGDPPRVALDLEGLGRIQATARGGPVQVCAYCRKAFPASELTCPHCRAPVGPA
jgi:hypothetical protein